MRPLIVGTVAHYNKDTERLLIEELQTRVNRVVHYQDGRSIWNNSAGNIRLSRGYRQGEGHALKIPEFGDAVVFEVGDDDRILQWGYLNRVLLASERLVPTRFIPRLITHQ